MSDIEREEAIEVMCELIVNAGDGTSVTSSVPRIRSEAVVTSIDTDHLRTLHNAGYRLPVEQGEVVSARSFYKEFIGNGSDLDEFAEAFVITRKAL